MGGFSSGLPLEGVSQGTILTLTYFQCSWGKFGDLLIAHEEDATFFEEPIVRTSKQ